MKKVAIAVLGVGAIGLAAFALTRGNSNSQQKQQVSSAFSGYSGGGATGGYAEPSTKDTVKSVLETVMSNSIIQPLDQIKPEMVDMMNPSDEAADVRQKTALAAGHVTSRATGESMYSLQSVYSSKGGETTGHVGGTRRGNTLAGKSKAVEHEENQ